MFSSCIIHKFDLRKEKRRDLEAPVLYVFFAVKALRRKE